MYKVQYTTQSGLSCGTEYSSVMNTAIVAALWGHEGITEKDVTDLSNNRYTLDTHHYTRKLLVEFIYIDVEVTA